MLSSKHLIKENKGTFSVGEDYLRIFQQIYTGAIKVVYMARS